ncbi:MAG: aldehyde dehydrogenase family protein [Chloroflexi bacterium]|nr:aldehyde dehydrogenase family protein [Chloroflexota bacterium]
MTQQYKFLVGGEWRTSNKTLPVHFPYTGEVVGEIFLATDQDIEDAIVAAVRGFEITRKLPAHARSEVLYNLIAQMEQRRSELIDVMILEGGKTRNVATGESGRAIETVRVAAEEAKRVNGEIVPMDWTAAGEQRQAMVRRVPLGPVLGITPFNYPVNLACHKLAPAIAVGNPFILKPAPDTPLSSVLLMEMALAAGYPPEALSLIMCRDEQAEEMVKDPRIAFLSFTGSSEVGWYLKGVCGRKRVGLELGGNAAAIIHEDANVDYAVRRIGVGGFTNAGQNCISVQRVLIHRPIYDSTLEKLLARVREIKTGDPREDGIEVGPMINQQGADKAMSIIQDAVDKGADLLIGGERDGLMIQPTVLANTTPGMRIRCEEVFGPVITVDAYDDFDEGLRIANETDYGLQSGIFTQNLNRIMRAFDEIEVGGLQINDVSTFRVDQMPYGGVKGSGVGREGPRYVIEEMTEMKLMVLNLAGGQE